MKRVLVLGAILACSIHHHVQLLLGTSETSPSSGFLCYDTSGKVRFAQALTNGELQFTLVVDLIDLGGTLTSGFADDIISHCSAQNGSPCKLVSRSCVAITVPYTLGEADDQVVHDVETQLLKEPDFTSNATDRPVIVRVAAMLQTTSSCDPSIDLGSGTVLGCAYSTPVVLDEVNAPLQLGIEAQASITGPANAAACIAAITTCAEFPNL